MVLLVVVDWVASVKLLMSEAVPKTEKQRYEQMFGTALADVDFRYSNSDEYFTRIIFGRKLCYLPKKRSVVQPQAMAESLEVCIIAHELGHLVNSDSAQFHRVIFLLLLSLVSMLWVIAASFYYLDISAWDFLQTMVGIVLFLFIAGSMLSYALHLREFSADKSASKMISGNLLREQFERLSKIEKYICFPLLFRITHPTITMRLHVLHDYYSIYRFDVRKAALFGISLGAASVLVNFLGDSVSARLPEPYRNSATWISFIAYFALLVYILFIMFYPAVIIFQQSLVQLFASAFALYCTHLIASRAIIFLFTSDGMGELRPLSDSFAVDVIISELLDSGGVVFVIMMALLQSLLYFVITFVGFRWVSCYRGVKFLPTWYLAVIIFLTALAAFSIGFAAVLWIGFVIGKVEWASPGVAILVSSLPLVLSLFCVCSYRVIALGNVRDRARFVSAEWDPVSGLSLRI